MSRTGYIDWATGQNLYAKPRPLDNNAWGDDDIAGVETGTLGEYAFAGLDEAKAYAVFLRAGASPASSDSLVGYLGATQLTEMKTELIEMVAIAVSELIGTTGNGEHAVTVTVSNSSSEAIQGARVTIVGTTLKQTTGSDGTVTFNLDAANYSVRVSAPSGYADPDDTAITVDGTEAVPITLSTTGTVTPPDDPLLATLAVLCVDAAGAPAAGVTIDARLTAIPASDTGLAYVGSKQSATSGADGVATLTVVRRATYGVKRGTSTEWTPVVIADEGTTTVKSFIGAP